jgi:MFS family permease
VFWINVPLGSAAALLAALLLPAPRSIGRIPPLDLPGIALNAGFIFCLSYALVEGNNHGWGSPLIVGLLAASVALFGLFVGREIATRQPMLDLGLFRRLAFSASILVTVAISFALLGVFFFMPLFLQGPKHDTALQSGLTLLPVSAAMFVAGPLGGYLAGHVRPHYPIMAAMLLFCGGMFWLSHLSLSTTWQSLIPPFIIIGLGLGMASANINTAAMGAVPRAEAGAAAGVIATIRQLGSVLGIAVLGAILQVRQQQYLTSELRHVHTQAGRAQAQLLSFTQALDDALLVCAGVLAAGAVAALMVRRRPGDDELQTEGAVQGATQRAGE